MSTRREVQEDPEMERIKAGDPLGALRAAQAKNGEAAALLKFFQANRDILPCQANEKVLLDWCGTRGAFATAALLDLALGEIRASLVATPPAAPPPPTAAELAAREKQRLLSASNADLHKELQQKNYKRREPTDELSPEVAALTTRAQIKAISAAEFRRLCYRPSDNSVRRANTEHINKILQGSN